MNERDLESASFAILLNAAEPMFVPPSQSPRMKLQNLPALVICDAWVP